MPSARLILFTRYPEPGEVKTRLIKELGVQGAANLQGDMALHLVTVMRHAAALPFEGESNGAPPISLEVRSTGAAPAKVRRWLRTRCVDQGIGGLGVRLARAFRDAFAAGVEIAAVCGGDCPQLTGASIQAALRAALHTGAALIPATDGGYCLLALRSDCASRLEKILSAIDWGTECVAAQQYDRITDAGIECVPLPALHDIDTPADLPIWRAIHQAFYEPPKTLSIIIPTHNERKETLMAARESIKGFSDGSAVVPEILMVNSCEVSVPNRAAQLNLGASRATSDALLFLHADTCLPQGGLSKVLAELADPATGLGAFSFAFDTHTPTLDLFAAGTRLRGRLLHSPYGDQAYFCRRAFFESLGGFPDLVRMEDFEFMRRANRVTRTRILKPRAITSARGYENHPWRTMLQHRREVLTYLTK
jgi:rSAM/selenodomain-associated transferase 1